MPYYTSKENSAMITITRPYHGEGASVWYIVKEFGDDWEVIDSARSVQEAQEKLAKYVK
jgi:hypothetical protein